MDTIEDEESKEENCFQIITAGGRPINLRAETDQERDEWMGALNEGILMGGIGGNSALTSEVDTLRFLRVDSLLFLYPKSLEITLQG